MPLPILDAGPLTSGSPSERQAFNKALVSALIRDGAVKLTNTSIPDTDIRNAFRTSTDFFHLPPGTKHKIANDPSQSQQRGWSTAGEEKTWYLEAAKSNLPAPQFGDLRESIDIGCVNDREFPNKWLPADLAPMKHRRIMENLFQRCAELSTRVMEALALGYGLPKNTFTERCTHEASTMRSNFYAALDTSLLDTGAIGRAWPHKDFGIISLVFPGIVGGLEYEDRSSTEHITFEPVGFTGECDIVLQVAETLQRWTNDGLPACLHRVQKPGREECEGGIAPERTSMVFFCKADRRAMVGPMEGFVRGRERRYEEMTALEYQGRRNKAHYPG